MNAKLNGRIAEEVGNNKNGHFIPIRDGKWFFPPTIRTLSRLARPHPRINYWPANAANKIGLQTRGRY